MFIVPGGYVWHTLEVQRLPMFCMFILQRLVYFVKRLYYRIKSMVLFFE